MSAKAKEEGDGKKQFERMKKAQINIQSGNPFFSYLSLYLKFERNDENNSKLPEWSGMGVSPDGTLVYKDDFVDGCSEKELQGVLCHEILHLSLLHLLRRGGRQAKRWNVAADIAVNAILMQNRFQLPSGGLIPEGNSITIMGREIEDVNTKTVEKIYDELPTMKGKGPDGEEEGEREGGFDSHREDGDKTAEEKEKQKNKWLNRMEEAAQYAKQKGKLPNGIGRLIDKLHKAHLNWKVLLKRFVTNEFPRDLTYASRHKKSVASGFYMPNIVKEKIEVLIGIDTSGSIGNKEVADFLSEIIGIAKAFQSQVDMRVMTCDTKVHEDLEVRNGNIDKIMSLKCEGGGGTELTPIFKHVKDKNYKPKIVVILTDGYCERLKKQSYPVIFVLSEGGTEERVKDAGVVVKMEDNGE